MGNAIVHKKNVDSVTALVERFKPRLGQLLPKHIPEGQFVNVFLTTLGKNPDLAGCSAESLLGALFTCAQLGLVPDGVTNQAHIVPYGGKATFQVGYKGLKALAERHDEVRRIYPPVVVHEKDTYSVERGMEPKLTHKPYTGPDHGDMIAVYAVAEFSDGQKTFEWLWKEDVDRYRAKAKSKSGPWSTDYDAMAKKTVILRLASQLPQSTEMGRVQELEWKGDRGEQDLSANFSDLAEFAPATESKTQQVRKRLTKKKEEAAPAELPPPEPEPQEDDGAVIKTMRDQAKKELLKLDLQTQINVLKNFGSKQADDLDKFDVDALRDFRVAVQDELKANK